MGIASVICPFVSIAIIGSTSCNCDSMPLEKISVSNCEKAFDENGTNYITISLTEQQQESYARIDKIASLKDNWNYNGAKAFSADLIDRCRKIVQTLSSKPEIFPTAIGAIQFEFRKSDGSYLEFEVYETSINEYRINSNGQELEKNNISISEMKDEVDIFNG